MDSKKLNTIVIVALVVMTVLAAVGGYFIGYNKCNNDLCTFLPPTNPDDTDQQDNNQNFDDADTFKYEINIPELNAKLRISDEDCEYTAKTPSEEGTYEVICRNMSGYGRAIILVDPIITGGGYGLFEMDKASNVKDLFSSSIFTDREEIEILDRAFIYKVRSGVSDFAYHDGDYFTSINYVPADNIQYDVFELFFYDNHESKTFPIFKYNNHNVIMGFEVVANQTSGTADVLSAEEEMIQKMIDLFNEGLISVE